MSVRARLSVGSAIPVALVALSLLVGVASAQSVALPGSEDSEAASSAAQIAELEAQVERSRARAEEWKAKVAALEQSAAGGPALLAAVAEESEALRQNETPAYDGLSAAELEVRLLSAEQDLALARNELADLDAQRARRPERRRELPDLLAQAKSRQNSPAESRTVVLDADDVMSGLQRQISALRGAALEDEVRALELELVGYDAAGKLLDAVAQREGLRVRSEETRIREMRAALGVLRENEAERAVEEAMASVAEVESLDATAREAVRVLASENAELAQGRTGKDGLLDAIDSVSAKLGRAAKLVSGVEADYQRLSERVASGGLSDSVGVLLHKTRAEMPDVGKYQRFIRMRQRQINEVQEQQLELREELESLEDVEALVARTVDSHSAALSEADREQLAGVVRDLLTTKRTHLAALLGDYEVYFHKLVDFDAQQQDLIQKTTQLMRFIDDRVLWVPSGGAVHTRAFPDAAAGLKWFSSSRNWGQVRRAAHALFQETLYFSALLLLVMLGAVFLLPRRMAPHFAKLKNAAQAVSCIEVRPTLECLGLSLLLVPWGPAAFLLLGWRLGLSTDATLFVRCISGGLLAVGSMWLTLELPRQILRPSGLAEAHFGWPPGAVRRMRSGVSWLAVLALPLLFLIQVFELSGEALWRESLGRFALIALMLVAAGVSHQWLRAGGAVREILGSMPSISSDRGIWRLLHTLAVGIPLGLSFAAARGYYWTSLQLGSSYHFSLFFMLMVLFAFQFALRGSLVAQRRIAFRLARDQREAERAARLAEDPSDDVSDRSASDGDEVDLAQVDAQTERLLASTAIVVLGIGLWFLWVEVVPAFGVLDTVELWTATEQVTIESTAPDGSRVLETEDRVIPFTAANLLLAAVIAFMTFVLDRNLAGLLEISLFRHLGTAKGERYAYTTIAKYTVALIGGVLAFNAVGIGWANIQWLVAAVGLGLGFGLQEIFANFVAGLIILFERPIRVGDTVTIGDIDGTVSRIRIRATWITSFDRKELVVPNKEFVTSRLVNWSLADPLVRVDVPVGVAYGSDTEVVIRELHAAARSTENVMSDPAPEALFLGFGESSLDFELRVYSPDVEHRLAMKHALHLAIDGAFREAGIEISFPQRDLHLRSTPGAAEDAEQTSVPGGA